MGKHRRREYVRDWVDSGNVDVWKTSHLIYWEMSDWWDSRTFQQMTGFTINSIGRLMGELCLKGIVERKLVRKVGVYEWRRVTIE